MIRQIKLVKIKKNKMDNNQNIPLKIKNHIVPICYLRKFGEELFVFDKRTKDYLGPSPILLKYIAFVKEFYSFPSELIEDVKVRNLFEDSLGSLIEAPYSKDFDDFMFQLNNMNGEISDALCKKLAMYTISQYKRSEAYRQIYLQYFHNKNVEINDVELQKKYRNLSSDDKNKIKQFLEIFKDEDDVELKKLLEMNFYIIVYEPSDINDINSFYTCDNPVLILNDLITFPISPTILLMWSNNKVFNLQNNRSNVIHIDYVVLNELNSYTYNNAKRFVYTPYKNITYKVVNDGRDTYKMSLLLAKIHHYTIGFVFNIILKVGSIIQKLIKR